MRPTILLVDDTPTHIRTLVEFLRDDFHTLVATSGEQALEIAAREQLDLVLLDVVMPGIDGHEVCRRLKQDAHSAMVPVIFVTGRQDEEDEMTGFELGAVDYVTKPFSLPVVHRRIRTHLELKRYRDELERQSLTDGLTGIPNRRRFESFLALAWAQAQRQQRPIALALIDIDHFKPFNDNYGHPAGDACLQRVAAALNAAMPRASDLLARYGGEEFVCVLTDSDLDAAAQVGERLREAVEAIGIPHAHSSSGDRITTSTGVASIIPGAQDEAAALLEAADQALYRAKHGGRNRVGR